MGFMVHVRIHKGVVINWKPMVHEKTWFFIPNSEYGLTLEGACFWKFWCFWSLGNVIQYSLQLTFFFHINCTLLKMVSKRLLARIRKRLPRIAYKRLKCTDSAESLLLCCRNFDSISIRLWIWFSKCHWCITVAVKTRMRKNMDIPISYM